MSDVTKINTHLIDLLENEEYAREYFLDKPIENYRPEKYLQLEKQTISSMKKYIRELRSTLLADAINLPELIRIEDRRTKKYSEMYKNKIEELNIFESDLAYLFINNKIPQGEDFWYIPIVIWTLLKGKREEIEQIASYHFCDKDGIKSLKLINDKMDALPYVPIANN